MANVKFSQLPAASAISRTDILAFVHGGVSEKVTIAELLSVMNDTDVTSALGYTPLDLVGGTMTGYLILNADPVSALGASTKSYVDNFITGLKWKTDVIAATTGNITLSGAQTIDDVAVIAGNRVLVKNQADQTENGLYVAAVGAWARSTDADTGTELLAGTVYVRAGGTTNGGTQWANNNTAITIGVTNITFAQIAGAGVYTNGSGLSLTGNVFSISNNGVSDAMIRQSAALSLVGNASNATANVADITAGSDHQVMRRSGTSLAFGAVNLASSNAVTGVLAIGNGGSPWVVTGSDLYYSTGNVGIGVASAPNAKLGITNNNLGTTQTFAALSGSGIVLENTQPALVNAQQISPAIRFRGKGWATNSGGSSMVTDWLGWVLPKQNAATPLSDLIWGFSTNGGTMTEVARFRQDDFGTLILTCTANAGDSITGVPGIKFKGAYNSADGFEFYQSTAGTVLFNINGSLTAMQIGPDATAPLTDSTEFGIATSRVANQTLTVSMMKTARGANTRVGTFSNSGTTINTTAAARIAYTGYFESIATRSSGANTLTNIAGYFTASGGQLNYAAIFEAGNVGIGTTTPTALFSMEEIWKYSTSTKSVSHVTSFAGDVSHTLQNTSNSQTTSLYLINNSGAGWGITVFGAAYSTVGTLDIASTVLVSTNLQTNIFVGNNEFNIYQGTTGTPLKHLSLDTSGNLIISAGSIKTLQPSGSGAGAWLCGKIIPAVGLILVATEYIEVNVDGLTKKIALAT